jgi:putative aldouronate transport system substrate-binding protein
MVAGGCATPGTTKDTTKATTLSDKVNPAGQFPITNEKTVITCYANVQIDVDTDKNEFLRWFEEKTNITLKVTNRPSNMTDESTTKNLLIASGDYPEIFLVTASPSKFTMPELLKYGMEDKILIPLNDLIDNYGFESKKLYEEFPDLRKIMTAPDGNQYGLNNGNQCGHCKAMPKMWVNMDWLEKLNMPVPTTTDEFEKMLLAFKNQNPDGIAAKDVIPLLFEKEDTADAWIVNSFIPYSPVIGCCLFGSNYCYTDASKKIIFSADKPEFKEALIYMNKLYEQDLIDKAAFSQTSDQAKVTMAVTPLRVGAYTGMHQAMVQNPWSGQPQDILIYKTFHAIAPVAGPKGVRYQVNTYGNSSVNQNTHALAVITNKCKNPEAAFRVLDAMMSEEVTMRKDFGVPDVDWELLPAGMPALRGGDAKYSSGLDPLKGLNEADAKAKTEALKEQYGSRKFQCGMWRDTVVFRNLFLPIVDEALVDSDPKYFETRLESETIPLEKYYYPYDLPNMLFMSADDTAEFGEMTTNINTYVARSVAEFVMGSRDIETGWEGYLADLKNYELEQMLALYQKAFDSYNK